MKKLILLVLVFILYSCFENSNENVLNDVYIENSRIIIKENTIISGYRYLILEIDGVEYLSNVHSGGIIKLEK